MSEFDENKNGNMQGEANNEAENQSASQTDDIQPENKAQPEQPAQQIPVQQPKQQSGYGSSPAQNLNQQNRYYGQGYSQGYGNGYQPPYTDRNNPGNQNMPNNPADNYSKKASYVYYGTNPSQYTQQGYPQNQYYQNQPVQTPNYSVPAVHQSQKGRKKGKAVFIICVAALLVTGFVLLALSLRGVISGTNGKTEKIDAPKIEMAQTPDASASGSSSIPSAKSVYQEVKDSSVGVLVYTGTVKSGEGSGVIVGEDDRHKFTYIVTCAHVVSGGGTIKVQLSDDTQHDAYLVGTDSRTDIAVLRIAESGLDAIEIGDSEKLVVGETVYAIGNPGGVEFAGSFTNGMVSAIARPISSEIGYEMICIQHTAAINPGNSGGALINEYGQLVGINSSKIASTDYEGMGFAVPSSTLVKVYDEIIAHGYVTNRPKLGIRYAPVSASQTYAMLAGANNLPAGSIIIAQMDSDSSLVNTDAKIGDIIIKANGKELENSDELPALVEKSKVGDKITLTVCHFDNNYRMTQFDVTATLVEDKGIVEPVTEQTTQPSQDYYYNPFGFYGFGEGNSN